MVLDVDDFKKINDSNGHMFGDSVLKAVAGILTRQFRSEDILARIGGDEFMISCQVPWKGNRGKISPHPDSVHQPDPPKDGAGPKLFHWDYTGKEGRRDI